MLCKRVVKKDDANEVSVEHVNLNNIYAVLETGTTDPMIVVMNSDDPHCAEIQARGWGKQFEMNGQYRSKQHAMMDKEPHVRLVAFIDYLLQTGKKVYEFDTLFDFCSWVIDLKQDRVKIPTNNDLYGKVKQHPHQNVPGTVHFVNIQGFPLCGSGDTNFRTTWIKSTDPVTCARCMYAYRNQTEAWKTVKRL